jgi:Domain of unknown function (DUF4145)
MSWWEFGEHRGYDGDELATYRITCPFCSEKGNFKVAHHSEKKNAAGKILNYDTLQCEGCGNLTMAFWSAARRGGRGGIHDYHTVPWARSTSTYPEHWPADVGRNWLQAQRSLEGRNWDAAAIMARSAIQLITRYQEAKGSNLKAEIDDLANRGILPPVMKDWAHEVRVLGNENAHPRPGDEGTSPEDARDVVEFLSFLLRLTYNLPHDIAQFRERRKDKD